MRVHFLEVGERNPLIYLAGIDLFRAGKRRALATSKKPIGCGLMSESFRFVFLEIEGLLKAVDCAD
jgi:hypothetical protein